jgi:hypothetical protein
MTNKYNRFIYIFLDDVFPNDLFLKLKDDEIEYWALLEIKKTKFDIDCLVYYLYLELKNNVDFTYIETIYGLKPYTDLCCVSVPLDSRNVIIDYFKKKSINGNTLKTIEMYGNT